MALPDIASVSDGQSQGERLAPEIDREHRDFVVIDERSPAQLLEQARVLAALVRHYRPNGAATTWSAFFPPGDAPIGAVDGRVAPHLGLFGAFLNLYRHPQQVLNRITERHLDFQVKDVLRFEERAATADRAHLVVELKKGTRSVTLEPQQRFGAGKDGRGVEIVYAPTRRFTFSNARVDKLHVVHRGGRHVHFAPVADSADGLGAPLPRDGSGWRPFGGPDLPVAQVGFAVASPVLRLQEGTRDVRIEVALRGGDASLPPLANVFAAYASGPAGWLGPFDVTATLAQSTLSFAFRIGSGAPPVVDLDPKVHAQAFGAHVPVVQVLLRTDAALPYGALAQFAVGTVRIQVDVDKLTALQLENDVGSLNPKKAFLPFGPQPVAGARFMIGSDEALSKRLRSLAVRLTWQGAPASLADHYGNYGRLGRIRNGVSASLVYVDRSGTSASATFQDILARDDNGTTTLDPAAPQTPATRERSLDERLFAYSVGGSALSRAFGARLALSRGMVVGTRHARSLPPPAPRNGFITLTLGEDFLHADYRRETVQRAVDKLPALNEPYTPTVQSISLAYSATSDTVDVGGAAEEALANPDVQFYQVGCFGPRRDHGLLREQAAFVADKRVTLLPQYPHEGELLVGLEGVAAGDGVTLLFQAAEGSADPELPPQALEWSVLCDNYWRTLTPQEIGLETTRHLRVSGIVAVALPRETTTEHTWLATGRVWLRAAIPAASGAASRQLLVAANAIEAVFVDQGNDPAHLAAPLPAGAIARLKAPLPGIKSVSQPFASFGGSRAETAGSLARRAAERLRHRGRCASAWDYERVVLEAFPQVHRVKCIAHASPAAWQAPGHVTLVVVPDLRNAHAVNRLEPRVDLDTLARIDEHVRARCAMDIVLHVKNPRYRRVRLDLKVRFRPGNPFNAFRGRLERALVERLAPWAYDARHGLEFGGRIYRSVLLDFVEGLDYVDFVTDFRLGLEDGERDAAQVAVAAPDEILVPLEHHAIAECP